MNDDVRSRVRHLLEEHMPPMDCEEGQRGRGCPVMLELAEQRRLLLLVLEAIQTVAPPAANQSRE